jgi:ATP phosphoribosyltransferase
MNGLRPIGDVLESEAVLVANPTAHRQRADDVTAIETMISAVIAARGRKYLMMNAPAVRSRTRGPPARPVAVRHPLATPA